jgi:hypothetical protein
MVINQGARFITCKKHFFFFFYVLIDSPYRRPRATKNANALTIMWSMSLFRKSQLFNHATTHITHNMQGLLTFVSRARYFSLFGKASISTYRRSSEMNDTRYKTMNIKQHTFSSTSPIQNRQLGLPFPPSSPTSSQSYDFFFNERRNK